MDFRVLLLSSFIALCFGETDVTRMYLKNGELVEIDCEDGNQWFKDGLSINGTSEYTITDSKLLIISFTKEYIGSYSCETQSGQSKTFKLYSNVNVTAFTSKSINLVQGEDLVIECAANGVDQVIWQKDNETLSDDSRITYTEYNSIGNGKLQIQQSEYEDAGVYSCTAGQDTESIKIRVKDRLAPLYPCIGILIEVILLIAIIFIFEKMRTKTKSEECDDGEENHLTNTTKND